MLLKAAMLTGGKLSNPRPRTNHHNQRRRQAKCSRDVYDSSVGCVESSSFDFDELASRVKQERRRGDEGNGWGAKAAAPSCRLSSRGPDAGPSLDRSMNPRDGTACLPVCPRVALARLNATTWPASWQRHTQSSSIL